MNPALKVLLTVGGTGVAVATWTAMLGDSTKRDNFIDGAITLARTYNFDGIGIIILVVAVAVVRFSFDSQ